MSLPRRNIIRQRSEDNRFVTVPGLGRVPDRPRAHDYSQEQHGQFTDNWRLGRNENSRRGDYWRPGDGYSPSDRSRDGLGSEDCDRRTASRSDHHMHFLARAFASRRREINQETSRRREFRRDSQASGRGFRNLTWTRTNIAQFRNASNDDARNLTDRSSKIEQIDHNESSAIPEINTTEDDGSVPDQLEDGKTSGQRVEPAMRSASPVKQNRCICPIGFECPAKKNGLVDCRLLVLEGEWKWKKAFEKDYQPSLPPDVAEEEEPFATFTEVKAIIKLLDEVPRRSRRSMSLRVAYQRMRDWIRRMRHNSITQETLDRSGVYQPLKEFLSDANRPLLIGKEVPQELIEDFTILYRKWTSGDFSVLPRRGLIRGGPIYWQSDSAWPFKQDAQFFGDGHLINGQVWASRAEMMRDGAHAPPMAGIQGTKKEGAMSVVMGLHDPDDDKYYADVDDGEVVWYIGTALKRAENDTERTNIEDADAHTYRPDRITKSSTGKEPTNATLSLFESLRTGRPVRLFRSFRLAKVVRMRPEFGFRYDGLYTVTKSQLLKRERQIYRFRMERVKTGQGPLRQAEAPLAPERGAGRKRKRQDEL